MYDLLNIPKHTNCKNCGACCDVIPASAPDIRNIKKYLKENPNILKQICKTEEMKCPFRNEEKKKCLIYEARPMVCRLMGVDKRMTCKHGNSKNIDGYKFMSKSFLGQPQLLNFVRWNE